MGQGLFERQSCGGYFVSTSSYGGGQESTVKACLSYLAHHGIIFLPLGYKNSFAELASIEEVHGGSPWGAGTLAGPDGSRTASPLELRIAEIQGKTFYETAKKNFSLQKKPSPPLKKKTTTSDAAKRQTKPAAATTAEKKEDKGLLSCCTVM
ncbi:Ycp4p [Saccharomyces cerevisiae FostersO]|nr:Ycp4p [Saccharomyces cerevisiae FostersO]